METLLQHMFGKYEIESQYVPEYEFEEIGGYANINMDADLANIDISKENELISRLGELMKESED